MASFSIKLMQMDDDIQLRMMKQQQSSLSEGFVMLFRVHQIVQQHPDHPDHRLTVKTSEKLLDVDFTTFLCHWTVKALMSDVFYNILQLHSDSRGRFLSLHGDGVQLFLSGLLDNKPTPVDSEKSFTTLFDLYTRWMQSDYEDAGQTIVPIVIDCEIVRCHQCGDLDEAIAWWESTPISEHDMLPAKSSSPSFYAEYKIRRLFGLAEAMYKVKYGGQGPKQCPICLEEFELRMEIVFLYCTHAFHEHCITHWFKKGPTCPVCRRVLD